MTNDKGDTCMRESSSITKKERLAALKMMIDDGCSVKSVADRFQVQEKTIIKWRSRYHFGESFKWLMRCVVPALIAIFIATVGFVCLKGLVESIDSFVKNQQTFNKAYSDAASAIASLSPSEKEAAQVAIDHLEQLQQIQKNAATSDVMSFLYSALSTVLVGLCAGFVAKGYSNAKKAEDNAQMSNASAEQAAQSAKKASQYFDDTIQKQKDAVRILSIHIEIVHARASLIHHDRIEANQRIHNISRSVLRLPSAIDQEAISRLQLELLSLETAVEQFREDAEGLSDGPQKTSMLQAIARYESKLDEAVKYCEMLLGSHQI